VWQSLVLEVMETVLMFGQRVKPCAKVSLEEAFKVLYYWQISITQLKTDT
jgi:hypothetical protein